MDPNHSFPLLPSQARWAAFNIMPVAYCCALLVLGAGLFMGTLLSGPWPPPTSSRPLWRPRCPTGETLIYSNRGHRFNGDYYGHQELAPVRRHLRVSVGSAWRRSSPTVRRGAPQNPASMKRMVGRLCCAKINSAWTTIAKTINAPSLRGCPRHGRRGELTPAPRHPLSLRRRFCRGRVASAATGV